MKKPGSQGDDVKRFTDRRVPFSNPETLSPENAIRLAKYFFISNLLSPKSVQLLELFSFLKLCSYCECSLIKRISKALSPSDFLEIKNCFQTNEKMEKFWQLQATENGRLEKKHENNPYV